ncbi:MAG TPA: sulfotransferase [Steroidobacteraceae bacterium]
MLNGSALIAEAQRRRGLQDLGEDSFREPLERLVDSINRESKMTPFGEAALPEMLIRALTNRLEIEDWYRRHPEIEEEEIVAPLFGVGMPRTGSTLLASLLSLDPQTRWLRQWESLSPCPPPIKGQSDFRVRNAEEWFRDFRVKSPDVFAMIPLGIDEPTEDNDLMYNSFCIDYYYVFSNCPSFLEWFYDPARDFSFGYRYHKRTLKLLQWRYPPKRWSLKLPSHSQMIEGLNKVYPDARFVWTHRDPVKVLPSVSRLVEVVRAPYLEDAQMDEFAATQSRIWELAMRRLVNFRTQHENRFFDVHHTDLLKNSPKEIERLYKWLGWPLDRTMADTILSWRDAHPRQDHSYRAESNRFDPADLRRRFAFYTDRFGTQ